MCWKRLRSLQHDGGIGSGDEVNAAYGGRLTQALPAIYLAHADLACGEQGPEQHGRGSAEGSTVCVLMRRLNSSCSRSIAFVVRADFHWLGGSRVKANSASPASSRLSAPLGREGDVLAHDRQLARSTRLHAAPKPGRRLRAQTSSNQSTSPSSRS